MTEPEGSAESSFLRFEADLRSAPAACKVDPPSYSHMDSAVSTFHPCRPSISEGFYFCFIFQMFTHKWNQFWN